MQPQPSKMWSKMTHANRLVASTSLIVTEQGGSVDALTERDRQYPG